MPNANLKGFIGDVLVSLTAGIAVYYLTGHLIKSLDPTNNGPSGLHSKDTKSKVKKTLATLQSNGIPKDVTFNDYELFLLDSLVLPEAIDVSFKDVGGLEDIIDDLRESVLYPLNYPELFQSGSGSGDDNSSLIAAPKGVLLYGPPGCGKTMLAKALAKESGANFISIRMSSIMDKWYGESNKIVDAIFSLAKKLQPCIIFIDEIDAFLRKRQSTDHEITTNIKSEFMQLWDGLVSSGRIMVLGATNRPNDIDEAILRRMPKKFQVNKPNETQRRQILEKLLQGQDVDIDNFDLNEIVMFTEGFSGSDLKELCRDAVMNAAKEFIKNNFVNGKPKDENLKVKIRLLTTEDFFIDKHKERNINMFKYGDGRVIC